MTKKISVTAEVARTAREQNKAATAAALEKKDARGAARALANAKRMDALLGTMASQSPL